MAERRAHEERRQAEGHPRNDHLRREDAGDRIPEPAARVPVNSGGKTHQARSQQTRRRETAQQQSDTPVKRMTADKSLIKRRARRRAQQVNRQNRRESVNGVLQDLREHPNARQLEADSEQAGEEDREANSPEGH